MWRLFNLPVNLKFKAELQLEAAPRPGMHANFTKQPASEALSIQVGPLPEAVWVVPVPVGTGTIS